MTGSGTETLTAALRRLADEHASGQLSVAAPGGDVVLELGDGIPVGIGPTHDVSARIGRDAGPELVAAAVVDDLLDRTVAAVVGGGGDWTWDVATDAAMMPLPPDLATELSRRAVDAAQALAQLGPEQVLRPGRDLETHGEVHRVRELFDGERTLESVAELANLTVPAVATVAAALVGAGVLTTGQDDGGPVSWIDAVAGSSSDDDEDEDEPELWVMDPPDDEPEDSPDDEPDESAEDEPEVAPEQPPAARTGPGTAADTGTDTAGPGVDHRPTTPTPPPAGPPREPAARDVGEPALTSDPHDAVGVGDVDPEAGDVRRPDAPATDDDWSDTSWMDGFDEPAASGAAELRTDDPHDAEAPGAARAALSAMISDLQGPQQATPSPSPRDERPQAGEGDEGPEAPGAPDADGPGPDRVPPDNRRKQPKAEPAQVAEFLRELSRLALDED